LDFHAKEKYDVYDLVDIVKILRSPEGCPWDKVQTHETIRKDFIEEVYEAVEAINENDAEHLREELGDVLLQVVFHSVIESEKGSFDLNDVADEVCKKMIVRHPHVFGDVTVKNIEQLMQNWDKIKMQTKSQTAITESMESVSKTLPSLMRAEKLHKRAKRGGVVPKNADEVFSDVEEKLAGLKASACGDSTLRQKKLGEFLFSAAALSGMLDTDCEQSLYDACDEFIKRFKAFEMTAAQKGIDIQGSDSEEANRLWKEILTNEKLEENKNEQN